MPPPRASGDSGRWHINCRRRDKLCGDLNSQPKRPGDPDLCPFDLESGVRVTCDVGYLCANFIYLFIHSFCANSSQASLFLIQARCTRQTSDVARQTSDGHHRFMRSPGGAGHNKAKWGIIHAFRSQEYKDIVCQKLRTSVQAALNY